MTETKKKSEPKQPSTKDLQKQIDALNEKFEALEVLHGAMGWPALEAYVERVRSEK